MGNTIWIKAEDASEDQVSDDLSYLYNEMTTLDRFCTTAGVTKLSEFHDNSEMAAEFGHEMEPSLTDPGNLLATLEPVRALIDSGEGSLSEETRERLLEDIDYCIHAATEANERGKRVRLIVLM